MTPEPLHRPYVGIRISTDDYGKVTGLLPVPSYQDVGFTRTSQNLIFVYVMDGHITSSNQYRWVSNIKLGIKNFLCIPFEFEENFYITDTTEITGIVYEIKELSKAFKAPLITYPKIMYPSNKKEIYRRLCWYGKRLIHQESFTKEAMISTALLMNNKLSDKYQNEELHKKAFGAYLFIYQNQEKFNIRLDEVELKEARSKGGKIRKDQRVKNTKERVQELLKSGDFIKPNGKVNLSSLAKAMDMTRKTVAKYVGD